jgi:ketosteroid isomerase-like protein
MDLAMNESERLEILRALEHLAETVKRAYAENDVELYLSAFDEDAIVSMPHTCPVRGHDELRRLFMRRPELPPGATFDVSPLELDPLNSDWAYAYGTDTLTHADGSSESMTFLVLIRKTDEGWKTFREVVSADQP